MEHSDKQVKKQDVKTPTRSKKNGMTQFWVGLSIVVIIAFAGMFVYAKAQVRTLSETPFALQVTEALRVPIASINNNPILYSEFMKDYQSLKLFYAEQPEGFPLPTQEDISGQVLSRLFINELIADMAVDYNIALEESDVAAAKAELLSQFGDEVAAAEEVQKTFGWSLDTFTDRVIVPIVLEQKVSDAFQASDGASGEFASTQVKARHILFIPGEDNVKETESLAKNVLSRIQGGEDFATLAAEFGSDGTATAGGDLGWIDPGVTVPDFEKVLFDLEAGELYGEVLETQFGYHIIQADDIRSVRDFPLYFREQLMNADIKIFADIANPFAEEDLGEELLQEIEETQPNDVIEQEDAIGE